MHLRFIVNYLRSTSLFWPCSKKRRGKTSRKLDQMGIHTNSSQNWTPSIWSKLADSILSARFGRILWFFAKIATWKSLLRFWYFPNMSHLWLDLPETIIPSIRARSWGVGMGPTWDVPNIKHQQVTGPTSCSHLSAKRQVVWYKKYAILDSFLEADIWFI